ncbi:hypothetical protein C0215_19655, partial [Clostridioides difficile]
DLVRVVRESWSKLQALRHGPEWPGAAGQHRRSSDPIASHLGQLFETQALGHGFELPGRAGGRRGPSGKGLSRPGRLVNTAGPLMRSQGSRESWSTLPAFGNRPESRGTAG